MTTAHHVPRWALLAAHVVPLLVLPSALWRLGLLAGLPLANVSIHEAWEYVYIVTLVLVCEGAALMTLGLVQSWGEVAPRWIPLIGGRPVRPWPAFAAAMTGATSLTILWLWVFWGMATTEFYDHFDSTGQKVLLTACYTPLLAWGPLLAVVAIAYVRRRRFHSVGGRESLSGGMASAAARTTVES